MRLASFGLTVDRLFVRSLNVLTRYRPANPRLGVRVWPGLDKPNPYPYPAVPGRVQQPVTIPTSCQSSSHRAVYLLEELLPIDKKPFIKYIHNGDAVPNVQPRLRKKGMRQHYFFLFFSMSNITLLVKMSTSLTFKVQFYL